MGLSPDASECIDWLCRITMRFLVLQLHGIVRRDEEVGGLSWQVRGGRTVDHGCCGRVCRCSSRARVSVLWSTIGDFHDMELGLP